MIRKTVLYRRQRQLFQFLQNYIEKFGYAPTLMEMAAAIHVSAPSTIYGHLQALERKGFIRRYRGAIRGIELLKSGDQHFTNQVEIPILGFISAGQPIEPYNDPNANLLVPAGMVPSRREAFILQVKGNSMIEEGILDQDYIIVERREMANNGDIVVAELPNGFATVKKFYQEEKQVRLEPANAKMRPIFTPEVSIRGKVIGVVRHFT